MRIIRAFAIYGVTLLTTAVIPAPVHAQGPQMPDVTAQTKAIADLGFLAGQWSGEGWIQMGPARTSFRQTERVAPFLDGGILLVEGRGVDAQDSAKTHHHAFAVLSWNADDQRYDFRSYSAGRSGTFPARLTGPGTLVWDMEMPGRKVRYTIRVVDDTWTESGEFSPDGTTWREFFHMTLTRTGAASFAAAAPAPR
jgi:hypothetical protein